MPYDVSILRALHSLAGKSALHDRLIVFFARYLPYLLVVFFGIFLFTLPEAERVGAFVTTTLATLLARFGVTELIRLFYKRPRPFDIHKLRSLFFNREWSFPSGHAVFFFALAACVGFLNIQWGVGFFFAATAMGVARIAAGVHYPSDILWGAVIGIMVAYASMSIVGL